MKEFISLIIIIIFTGVIYYAIGPVAKKVEGHKFIPNHHFTYSDIPPLKLKGNVAKGKALVFGAGACIGCHSIKSVGIAAPMSPVMAAKTYGVVPPDLSDAGVLYSPKFLAAYIANPVKAMLLQHRYNAKNGKVFPMPAFAGAGGNKQQEIADMVAYFKSIAFTKKISPKTAFVDSCGRCHAIRFDKWTQIGFIPKFKNNLQKLKFELKVTQYQKALKKYKGSLPPDLSTILESRNKHFVEGFMENPQNYIKNTAMPRVGVTAATANQIEKYLFQTSNPEHAQRESLGRGIMIYLFIFAFFAYLWKRSIWKDLH